MPCPCASPCPRRLQLSFDFFFTQQLLDEAQLRRALTLELRLLGFRVLTCPMCRLPFDAGDAGEGFVGVNRVVRCPYGGGGGGPPCGARICLECGSAAHNGRACGAPPEAPGLSQKDMDALGVKHCPACSIPVTRIEGCPAMVCGRDYHGTGPVRGCGARFCWSCLGVVPLGRSTVAHKAGCSSG